MKVSEPEERPEKVKPQEYHDAVNQNSNDENVGKFTESDSGLFVSGRVTKRGAQEIHLQ